VPNNVNFQIPFNPPLSIAEQIIQGLHEGFQERQAREENAQRQTQLGIDQQRANSESNLQQAQTEQIQENMRRRKVLTDMFQPKADSGPAGTNTSSATRSDFERIVDQSDLPDDIKGNIKLDGSLLARVGEPEKAFDYFQRMLELGNKKVTPHILFNNGIPYGVTDRYGTPFELHDPNIPDELKPLVQSTTKIFNDKNILPPGDVQNANLANGRRWQVLHPGQSLPSDLTLQPNASKDEYSRVEKQLTDLMQLESVKIQRDQANAARDANQKDREEKEGMKWVSWQDKDGRTVAGSLSQARQMGAKNPAEVPTEEIRNITDASGAVRLISKQGDPQSPETMGVLQLADALNKEGKLGVFASRFNDFMTKGVGASPDDDPRIVTLLDKSQLLMTLAMKAHFGASGGRSPQMLEHFIGMANAGKMDGNTFMAGAKAVGDYMKDRAMEPGGSTSGSSAPASGGFSPNNPFAPKTNPFATKGPQ